MSQMYDEGNGFIQNDRMRCIITDLTDPFQNLKVGQTGRINLIDLANLDTCSFIATDDIGYLDTDNNLHIMGRVDNSDIRGCNLLL